MVKGYIQEQKQIKKIAKKHAQNIVRQFGKIMPERFSTGNFTYRATEGINNIANLDVTFVEIEYLLNKKGLSILSRKDELGKENYMQLEIIPLAKKITPERKKK